MSCFFLVPSGLVLPCLVLSCLSFSRRRCLLSSLLFAMMSTSYFLCRMMMISCLVKRDLKLGCEFKLPVSVREFYDKFIGDEAELGLDGIHGK